MDEIEPKKKYITWQVLALMDLYCYRLGRYHVQLPKPRDGGCLLMDRAIIRLCLTL